MERIFQLTVGALAVNCYIAADENGRAAVIDPGDEATRIRRVLEERGLTLEAILLTHAHFDHIGAVRALADDRTAIYCHEADVDALADGRRNLSALFGEPLMPVTGVIPVKDGDVIRVGQLTFTVLHTPGHTPGGVCYRLKDTLFSGDTLFCESVGRTDFPGGSGAVLRQSLARLLALEDDLRVYPGHGEATLLSHERQYNPFIG